MLWLSPQKPLLSSLHLRTFTFYKLFFNCFCIHGGENLNTLLVKYYFFDLLGDQISERSRNEVTFLFVGDVLCLHLDSKYADFQEKIFAEISGKKFQTLGIT